MTSTWFMVVMVIEYLIIAVAAGMEHNWPRFWYFVCAGGITLSVMAMK